jgi:hypothetical protein
MPKINGGIGIAEEQSTAKSPVGSAIEEYKVESCTENIFKKHTEARK